jgi:hypothetical protein
MSGYLHAKDRNDLKNKEVFKKECDVFINAAIPIGEIVLPDKGCLITECFFLIWSHPETKMYEIIVPQLFNIKKLRAHFKDAHRVSNGVKDLICKRIL